MAHVTLKRLLSKRKPAASIVDDLIRTLGQPITVEDTDGNLLVGTLGGTSHGEPATAPFRFPVEHDSRLLGWASGSQGAESVAALLQYLAAAEVDRRALADEVLDRYRELNLLYNLSTNLALSLNPEAIAEIALEEAARLIKATGGFVLMQEERQARVSTIASIGADFQPGSKEHFNDGLFGRALRDGNAEIQNDIPAKSCFAGAGDELCSVLLASLKTGERVFGLIVLLSQPPVRYSAGDLKLLNTVAMSAAPYMAIAALYARQVAMATAFSRFVPHDILRFLNKESVIDFQLGDHVRQELALLVSDIRSFTTLSENMTPRENFEFVNRYLAAVSPIIRENRGFILKYGGDSIMALFPDRMDDALQASLDTMEVINALNAQSSEQGFPPFHIGVGLHTGTMMLGIVGETERMQGDVFSDAVNVAARIEAATRFYDVNIAISAEALARLTNPEICETRFLGDTQVKGRQKPVRVYEVVVPK